MRTSFKKSAATKDAGETEPENSERTLGQPQRGPVSAGVTHQGMNDMTGEWLAKDRRLTRLNIVQKSSAAELLKAFDLGDIVFGKSVKIADENNPAIVVPILAHKDYQQVVPFGSGSGVVYRTEEEVFANGGTTEYSEQARNDKIYFGPRAHIQFGIKAPEGAEENEMNYFPFTAPNGDNWALGIITVASSSWTALGKELETLRQNNRLLMQGLVFGMFELTSAFKKKLQNEWYVPIAKLIGPTDPGLRDFLLTLSGISASKSTEQPAPEQSA
jgi:hypothetical protein